MTESNLLKLCDHRRKLVWGILIVMKKIFLFIGIFVLGGVAYAFLNPYLQSLLPKQEVAVLPTPTTEDTKNESTPVASVEVEEVSPTQTVTIAPDGSLLDGPFYLFDAQGNKTDATVQIVRSPEETLLQFEDFEGTHSNDADIYFSTDLKATSYVSLGFAKLKQGTFIYGVPLDADLSPYAYILVYDVRNKNTEYYAKIR